MSLFYTGSDEFILHKKYTPEYILHCQVRYDYYNMNNDYYRLFFTSFFFPSHLLSPPFYSLSLLSVIQIRGRSHSRLFSPPTHYLPFVPCTFFRGKISALSSLLVDARRIVLTHARRSQQLILFLFLQINSKSRHGAGFELTDQQYEWHSRAATSPPGRPV